MTKSDAWHEHEMKRPAAALEDLYERRRNVSQCIRVALVHRTAETPADRLSRLHVAMHEIEALLYPPDREPVRQDADGHWIWDYTCQRCHTAYQGRDSMLCPTCREGTLRWVITLPREVTAWTHPFSMPTEGIEFVLPKSSPKTRGAIASSFRSVADALDSADRDDV